MRVAVRREAVSSLVVGHDSPARGKSRSHEGPVAHAAGDAMNEHERIARPDVSEGNVKVLDRKF
jgi:hypothetical protein